jgi:hypothetical protein
VVPWNQRLKLLEVRVELDVKYGAVLLEENRSDDVEKLLLRARGVVLPRKTIYPAGLTRDLNGTQSLTCDVNTEFIDQQVSLRLSHAVRVS